MDGRALLSEFDHEATLTRKTLERVPFDKGDWKPHEKSMPLRELASHVADIPSWVKVTMNQDVFEMDGPYELPQVDDVDVTARGLRSQHGERAGGTREGEW